MISWQKTQVLQMGRDDCKHLLQHISKEKYRIAVKAMA